MAVLPALVTGQRGHALHHCSFLMYNYHYQTKCVITLSSKQKYSRPGFCTEPVEILAFLTNEKLRPVTHVRECLTRTESLMKGRQLFVSFVEPHVTVGRQSFSRWKKLVLPSAGFDVGKFTSQKTPCQHVSCSKMQACSVDCDESCWLVEWKNIHKVLQMHGVELWSESFGRFLEQTA